MPARPADARSGQGARWGRRHAPARGGGGRLRLRNDGPPAPEHERRDARALGGELQAPRGGEPEAGDLADDHREPALAQPLLEDGENVRLVPGLDEEDAVRMKAGGRQAGREEIPPAQAPQHGAAEARREPGREQNGRSALLARRPGFQDLVNRTTREPSRGEMGIEGRHPEGQRLLRLRRRPLQPCDPRP